VIAALTLLAAATAFDYDARAALDVREHGRETAGDAAVTDLTYASPQGGRVSAFLVAPPGAGPFAGVVFMHAGASDRSEFLGEAIALSRRGAVSLLVDAAYRRAEPPPKPKDDARDAAARDRDDYVGLVVDLRRAVDLLAARPEVDRERLGYVGHSLGATWGGALAGVEPRLRAFVLMAGLPDPGDIDGSDPYAKMMRTQLGDDPKAISRYESIVGAIAPALFVSKAPAGTLFFQFARRDRFISAARAEAFAAAAGPSHRVRAYFTGHELADDDASADRRAWLAERLKLR
jgi:dienelactone hydrolase